MDSPTSPTRLTSQPAPFQLACFYPDALPLQAIVPKVFSEASGAVAFPEHGDAYEQVRHALGLAIAAAK